MIGPAVDFRTGPTSTRRNLVRPYRCPGYFHQAERHTECHWSVGFEQIEIEFDAPAGRALMPATPVSRWLGGHTGGRPESWPILRIGNGRTALRAALRRFVQCANSQIEREAPGWFIRFIDGSATTHAGSQRPGPGDGATPSWFGTAYRKATGEGPMERPPDSASSARRVHCARPTTRAHTSR